MGVGLVAPLYVVRVGIGAGNAVVELDVVEAGGFGVSGGRRHEVEFADAGGLVAIALEQALEHGLGSAIRGVVDAVFMAVGIAAGEVADAGGDADGGLYEGVRTSEALGGELVEIGGLDEFVAVGAEAIESPLVEHDDEDVGFCGDGGLRGGRSRP